MATGKVPRHRCGGKHRTAVRWLTPVVTGRKRGIGAPARRRYHARMQCSRSLSLASIAPRLRALPRAARSRARSWLGAALGLALGLSAVGCTFAPTGQPPDDIGPGPGADAAQPLDGRQPVDGGQAGPIDAPDPPDAGQDGKPTLPAYPVEDDEIAIDGDLEDWDDEGWIEIEAPASYRTDHDSSPASADDLSMRFAARWHPDLGLYLAFEVTDDFHVAAPGNNDVLWRGDSVQAGFDVGRNGGNAYDGVDDFEYGWALSGNGQPREHRWHQGSGAPGPQTEFQVVRSGVRTIYEIRMPSSNLGLPGFAVGRRIGFSAAANDDDADIDIGDDIRDGWLEWTPGIAASKTPSLFGVIELREDPDD
jgi:hypothetical protein